jgi:hypothetical protein
VFVVLDDQSDTLVRLCLPKESLRRLRVMSKQASELECFHQSPLFRKSFRFHMPVRHGRIMGTSGLNQVADPESNHIKL